MRVSEQITEQLSGSINKKNWSDLLYNAKVEGLKGDGITDDTAKLQALIDKAILAGRKTISFPDGTYKVTALTNDDQVVFIGDNASFTGGYTGTIHQIGGSSKDLVSLKADYAKEVGQVFNIKGYGAVVDGTTDDTAAVQSAVDDAFAKGGGTVFIPKGTVYTIESVIKKQGVIIWDFAENGALFRILDLEGKSDLSTFRVDRKAKYLGGTSGFVNSGIHIGTTVEDGVQAFEWGLKSILNNFATEGEHVAIYGQGNKEIDGGKTWAGVMEVIDRSGGTLGTLVGLEIGMLANGNAGVNRVLLDAVYGKQDAAGTKNVIHAGLRIALKVGYTSSDASLTYGIEIADSVVDGIKVGSNGTRGINITGTNAIGIDLSLGTNSGSALRIKKDEFISLDETSTIKLKYNSTTGYIEFYRGTDRKGYIDVTAAATDHAL